MTISLSACSPKKEASVFDRMLESPVAEIERSDGSCARVWETDSLSSLAGFELEEAVLEPADQESDWLYRITYNPKDVMENGEEIVVSFHADYLRIDSEFYLPKNGVNYQDILEWVESKFDYFFEHE